MSLSASRRLTPSQAAGLSSSLCLTCGFCCDGTLFKDVELQLEDDEVKLGALGIRVQAASRRAQGTTDREVVALKRSGAQALGASKSVPLPPFNVSNLQRLHFPQPCSALCADLQCRIYPDRPARCRDFECALFQSVAAGSVRTEAALRTIRATRLKIESIREQFRSLGARDENVPLSIRFRRLRKRMETTPLDQATADTYAELTQAMHALNLVLRREFYPDPAD